MENRMRKEEELRVMLKEAQSANKALKFEIASLEKILDTKNKKIDEKDRHIMRQRIVISQEQKAHLHLINENKSLLKEKAENLKTVRKLKEELKILHARHGRFSNSRGRGRGTRGLRPVRR